MWVCTCAYSKHTAGKKSQRKPEVIQSDSRPSVLARRNDRGSSDKLSLCLWSSVQHSSFSTSICDPRLHFFFFFFFHKYTAFLYMHVLFSSKCTSFLPVFICGWVCMLCRVAVFQMSPQGLYKQQMGRSGSVSFLSFITKIMWWCDTQRTTKGKTDLIPFPYKVPPLFWLCMSGKKTDAEAI